MRRIIGLIILLIILVIYTDRLVFAEIVINELYPAPPSGETEWVELFNNESSTIDVTNYSLSDLSNNKIKIATTSASSYEYIIATSTNVLNNTGDTIFLKNALMEVIDVATYSGTFNAEKTWARCPDATGSWYTLNTTTKQNNNDSACTILTPIPTSTLFPTASPTPTIIPTPTNQTSASPVPSAIPAPIITPTPTNLPPTITPTPNPTTVINKIYLSEIMANPNTGESEWVELYNNNDFVVTLDNWIIDDQAGAGATPYYFSLTIPSHEYNSFNLSKTMFNNDGDQINLYNSNNVLQDSFEYQKAEKNISLGRINWEDDDFCEQNPSKNLSNNECFSNFITQNPTPTLTLVPTIKNIKKITNIPISSKPQTFYSISNKNNSMSYFPNQSFPLKDTKTDYKPNVLGLTSNYLSSIKYPSIINYLNFLSISYSFLTIGGILVKMKRCS